jgi:hypothetical protein
MKIEQLNDCLDRALNIIISLEEYASEQTAKDIEALFQELKYSDDIDADMEAQDFDKFGQNKIIMKSTKIMLAIIATFLNTWCVLGLIGYLLSDLSFRDCLICGPTLVLMLVLGWIPALLVGRDVVEYLDSHS